MSRVTVIGDYVPVRKKDAESGIVEYDEPDGRTKHMWIGAKRSLDGRIVCGKCGNTDWQVIAMADGWHPKRMWMHTYVCRCCGNHITHTEIAK